MGGEEGTVVEWEGRREGTDETSTEQHDFQQQCLSVILPIPFFKKKYSTTAPTPSHILLQFLPTDLHWDHEADVVRVPRIRLEGHPHHLAVARAVR
jgi:hypothetical protein